MTLRQETSNYPWSGTIRIAVDPEAPAEFTLKLRIPGWAQGATLTVNGEPVDVAAQGARLSRDPPALANGRHGRPRSADAGRAHLRPPGRRGWTSAASRCKRGPLVYCVEQVDNPGAVQRLKIGAEATPVAAERPDLLGGIVTVVADGLLATTGDWDGNLYRSAPVGHEPAKLTAIPYYLWANREPGPMRVSIPEVLTAGSIEPAAPALHPTLEHAAAAIPCIKAACRLERRAALPRSFRLSARGSPAKSAAAGNEKSP